MTQQKEAEKNAEAVKIVSDGVKLLRKCAALIDNMTWAFPGFMNDGDVRGTDLVDWLGDQEPLYKRVRTWMNKQLTRPVANRPGHPAVKPRNKRLPK